MGAKSEYENTIAPSVAVWAAIKGFTERFARIGAVIDADVIIATVPLPYTRRTSVATKNGSSTGGMGVFAIKFAM